jgi:hypothetical protein
VATKCAKILAQLTQNYSIFFPRYFHQALRNKSWGSGIRKNQSRIQGSKKHRIPATYHWNLREYFDDVTDRRGVRINRNTHINHFFKEVASVKFENLPCLSSGHVMTQSLEGGVLDPDTDGLMYTTQIGNKLIN